ncbi:hypothetical protein V6N12_029192 [Hibiscus sabdariffa]|uniref:Uncharacterized protein n=1 Tax=Hibiscus sabdariffa TaxID=183260 RepID=A0ABR2CVU5_9ROSI
MGKPLSFQFCIYDEVEEGMSMTPCSTMVNVCLKHVPLIKAVPVNKETNAIPLEPFGWAFRLEFNDHQSIGFFFGFRPLFLEAFPSSFLVG